MADYLITQVFIQGVDENTTAEAIGSCVAFNFVYEISEGVFFDTEPIVGLLSGLSIRESTLMASGFIPYICTTSNPPAATSSKRLSCCCRMTCRPVLLRHFRHTDSIKPGCAKTEWQCWCVQVVAIKLSQHLYQAHALPLTLNLPQSLA